MPRFENFKATLKEKKYLTPDTMHLGFNVPFSFDFAAGQFVIIKMAKGEETKNRSFSILNPPSEKGKIELCVKIIEDGFASAIFKKALPGDTFEMQGPFGFFVFDEKRKGVEQWMVCNGTGITPLYAMLMEHVKNKPEVSFTLLFGCKTVGDILFYNELKKLAQQCHNLKYLVTLSQEKTGLLLQGRVQEHLPADTKNKIFYLCGVKEMVLDTQQLLKSRDVSPENIKLERYT